MSAIHIAKTFTESAGKMQAADRGRVFDFLTKFMENPANSGLNYEGIQGCKDNRMRSARVTQGFRAIVHQCEGRHHLLYVGKHDDAYDWAVSRRVERHPVTGTLQIIEAAESVEELLQPNENSEIPLIFEKFDDNYLVSLGLPEDWVLPVRQIRTDKQLWGVLDKLPEEVAERLFALSEGELVTPPAAIPPDRPIEESPENLRCFWVVQDLNVLQELRSMWEKPIEAWVRFLHPAQREMVTMSFNGPVKITGAAGTGKTVVGLHRAFHLAEEGKRVLLTSYVTTLCQNLEKNIHLLCEGNQQRHDQNTAELITVSTVHSQALAYATKLNPKIRPANEEQITKLIKEKHRYGGFLFDSGFLEAEWKNVIVQQGISSWDEYRDAARTGRGKPLNVKQRKQCWEVFGRVYESLEQSQCFPWSQICRIAREGIEAGKIESTYDAVIVDEVQDLQPQDLRLLAVLSSSAPGNLMLLGDAGQRIYPGGYSLKALGIDVRGRSKSLRINYRTTDQIRRFADHLIPSQSDNLDEGKEERRSRSLLHGPEPILNQFKNAKEQAQYVLRETQRLISSGLLPSDIAIFSRVGSHSDPIREEFSQHDIPYDLLSQKKESSEGVQFGTMHRAKGLEFKAVFMVNCHEGEVPHQHTLRKFTDSADYENALERERQLLYVAVTRARDELFLTWVDKPSQFLGDLTKEKQVAQ